MKNSLRRIFALLMAVMMLAALGMSVAAADPYQLTFTKKLTKEEKAYAPNTTYEFTITAGNKAEGETQTVYPGVLDAIKFIENEDNQVAADDKLTITSTPANGDTSVEELLYTGKIEIDVDQLTNPGIYRYVITETKGDYAGVTYDTSRTLDVFVVNGTDGAEVFGYELKDAEGKTSGNTGNFVNAYDTADLTVTNNVTGNLGDADKEFEYTLEIVGAKGEQYLVELADGSTQTITAGEDGKASLTEIKLTNGDYFKVYGLSAGDSYTVTQENYAADGYTTTNDAETPNGLVGSGAIQAIVEGETEVKDDEVTFTNNNETSVPTGIAMTILPFVAMVAMAALVAVIFFQKKQRREA